MRELWTGTKRTVVVAVSVVAVACGTNDPAGPALAVEGTYVGAWTFDVFIEGDFVSRAVCPGSITFAGQEGRSFGGAFLVRDEGDCFDGGALAGDVLDGRVRADGGLDFLLSRVPVVGAGVAGCVVQVDAETGGVATGAVEAGELSAFTTAGLDCGDRGAGAAEITMRGVR